MEAAHIWELLYEKEKHEEFSWMRVYQCEMCRQCKYEADSPSITKCYVTPDKECPGKVESPKRFPVPNTYPGGWYHLPKEPAMSIPWEWIEPHRKQAARNHHGRSLERLAENGGVAVDDLVCILQNKKHPGHMSRSEVLGELLGLVLGRIHNDLRSLEVIEGNPVARSYEYK